MARLEKGTTFAGRFSVLDWVGAGGMADVYRALDEQTGGQVALKVLSKEFLSARPKEAERNLRRFKREAEILRLLSGSPHVVGIVGDGVTDEGDHYIAMEFVEGEQLRYYMGRGRAAMGIPTFLPLALHLAQGLKEIHDRGILHRDLAPDNVIVALRNGALVPVYLDFGIGKSVDNNLDHVTVGLTIMGKPQYFSPEQARGQDLSGPSDVYSLGVVLYEMASGYVPLEIHGIPDFRKIVKDAPRPLGDLEEGARVPEQTRGFIMRCLEKAADKRPTLEELIAHLSEVQSTAGPAETGGTRAFPGPQREAAGETRAFTPAPARTPLPPGSSIGRYEIKSLLGRGGMGAVYLCWDPQLHRELAIKVATGIEEEQAQKAILREARASSSLEHDNIVRIYDCGVADRTPYIAMEYVKDGRTVDDLIEEQGTVAGDQFWEVARGMLAGLSFAHAQANPIIHRDLKPANLLIARHRVKITDFGIATRLNTKSMVDTGSHGLGSGTAATMSPEQVEAKDIDHRSDIYSAGCVLYWMACGRPPFIDGGMAIYFKKCTEDPPSPLSVNPKLRPKGLDAIIMRCLAREPADRYQSAGQILQDLEPLFVTATTTGIVRPWYKTPAPWIGAGAAAVLAGGLIFFLRPPPTPPKPEVVVPPPSIATLDIGGQRRQWEPERKEWFTSSQIFGIQGKRPQVGIEWSGEIRPEDGSSVPTSLSIDGDLVAWGPRFSNQLYGAGPDGQGRAQPEGGFERFSVRLGTVAAGQTELPPERTVEFSLLYDARPPEARWRAAEESEFHSFQDGEARPSVLRRDDVEVRVEDVGAGLGEQGLSVSDWVAASALARLPGVRLLPTSNEDRIDFQVEDRAGHRRELSLIPSLKSPTVALLATDVRSAGGFVEILADVAVPPGVKVPTRGLIGLVAQLRQGEQVLSTGALTLSSDGAGRYRAEVGLPAAEPGSLAAYRLTIAFDDRPMPDVAARVTLDRRAPVLLDLPADAEIGRSHGALARKFTGVRVSDGEGGAAPGNLEIEVQIGDLDLARLEVAADGSLPLPDRIPDDLKSFPLRLRARDDLGNVGEWQTVQIAVQTGRIQSIRFGEGALALEGPTFLQPDRQDLSVTLEEIPEEGLDLVATIEGPGAPAPVALRRQGTSATWKTEQPLGLPSGQFVWKVSDRAAAATDGPLASGEAIVDGTPPTAQWTVDGQAWTPGSTLRFGHFPEVEVTVTDDHALDPSFRKPEPRDRLGLAAAVEEIERSGPVARFRIGAPPSGLVTPTTFAYTVAGTDRSGNALLPIGPTFEVVPPRFVLEAVDGRDVQPGQFAEAPYITMRDRIAVRVRNQNVGPAYAVFAAAEPDTQLVRLADATAGSADLELSTGGRKSFQLVAVELRPDGSRHGEPIPIDSVSLVRDVAGPTVRFRLAGSQQALTGTDMARESHKVESLRSVRIDVEDDVLLPPRSEALPPGLQGVLELEESREDKDRRRRTYMLAATLAPREGATLLVSVPAFRLRDHVGNETAVPTFQLELPDDAPQTPKEFRLGERALGYIDQPIRLASGASAIAQFPLVNRAPAVTELVVEVADADGKVDRYPFPKTQGDLVLELDLGLRSDGTPRAEGVFEARVLYRKDLPEFTELKRQRFQIDRTPPTIVLDVDGASETGPRVEFRPGMRLRAWAEDRPDSSRTTVTAKVTDQTTGQSVGSGLRSGDELDVEARRDAGRTLLVALESQDPSGNLASRTVTIVIPELRDEVPPEIIVAVGGVPNASSAITFTVGLRIEVWAEDLPDTQRIPPTVAVTSQPDGRSAPGLRGAYELDIDADRDAGKTLRVLVGAVDAAGNQRSRQFDVIVPAAAVPVTGPPRTGAITVGIVVSDAALGLRLVGIASAGGPLLFGTTEISKGQYKVFAEAVRADRAGAEKRILTTKNASKFRGFPPERALRTALDTAADVLSKGANSRTTDDQPITGVPYTTAHAYALWAGARLPTLEEWLAAAGMTEGESRRVFVSKSLSQVADAQKLDDRSEIRGLADNVTEWVVAAGTPKGMGGSPGTSFTALPQRAPNQSNEVDMERWGIRVVRETLP